MNQRTQLPSLQALNERLSTLKRELPEHLQRPHALMRQRRGAKMGAQTSAQTGAVGDALKGSLERLEGLRVEALLLLEQAGLSPRHVVMSRSPSAEPVSALDSEPIASRNNLEEARSPSHVAQSALNVVRDLAEPKQSVRAQEGDLLAELESYVSPLEQLERELAEAAAEASERAQQEERDELERALAQRALERAQEAPQAPSPSQREATREPMDLSLLRELSDELSGELSGEPLDEELTALPETLMPEPVEAVPTEAVPTEAVPTEAVPTEAVPTEAVELSPEARDLPPTREVPSLPPAREVPTAQGETRRPDEARAPLSSLMPATPSVWPQALTELKAILPPKTRSPDAQQPFVGSGAPRHEVVSELSWELPQELDWSALDLPALQRELGAYHSLSLAPQSFTPQAPKARRPVELKLQAVEGEHTLPSDPPYHAGVSHDSLDLDSAFAEYDQPVTDEQLMGDPELEDMSRAYSALEMSLEEALAPTMASRDFSEEGREALFAGLEPDALQELGLDEAGLDELGAREREQPSEGELPSSSSALPATPFNQQASLNELLAISPLEEVAEMDFDFGEDSPMVWTEGSPTPLFSDEASPSPVFDRRPSGAERPSAQERVERAEPTPEGPRSLFGRLFGKDK